MLEVEKLEQGGSCENGRNESWAVATILALSK